MRTLLLILGIVLTILAQSYAYEIPDNLWRGLVAEACADGYSGIYAVAACVRNRLERGMNIGLCGLDRKDLNKFVARQGKKYELMAKQIIKKVFQENGKDVTNGAIYFENIEAYGKPKWCKQKTIKIKQHTFYK